RSRSSGSRGRSPKRGTGSGGARGSSLGERPENRDFGMKKGKDFNGRQEFRRIRRMDTVMIPNAFPAAIPAYAGPQGGGWRPAPHSVLRAYPMARPAAQHWRPNPIQLGQLQPTPA